MKRRRLIAIISVCTLFAIGFLMVVGVAVVMRTNTARNFVQQLVASRINGHFYLGRISGNPLSGLTVDTVALRDSTGEMVLSAGRVTLDYDIRDIFDSRVHLRHVTLEHPYIHLRDHGSGKWNYMMMKPTGPSLPGAKKAARTWGSYFVFDSVQVKDAAFLLTLPSSFDDTLRGRVRDSVIAHDLKRTDRKITVTPRTPSGYSRTYMWTRANGLISHARIADPDSNQFGQEFRIARLDVAEFDPPFLFRNVRGVVRTLGDSAWFNLPHFDLPGSTGSGTGKLVWGSDLPMRYDIVVRGDSVSLADINWVYNTLPTTGSGKMVLRITNKRNLRVMDYHIDSMDVKSTRSHLIGEMTFGVGGGLPLQVRNVNLKADPVDFALIETLSGKPLPVPWAGQIFGDVRAPGGLVTDFAVTSFNGMWRDSHVPGAVSRFSGRGGLNILFPAFTAFHGFDVNVQSLDLRSIEYLFPAFPKLGGTIGGTATLDSVWTDVRFSNADVTHRDGPGTPSRFTGSGRITDGSPFITYDVDLTADPVSFDMLRRSFPGLKLRGLAYGPIRITGQSPDLQIAANLVSAAGRLRFAGNIDLDSLGGYGARGVGEFADVDLSRITMRDSAAKTTLNGAYNVNVRGATLSTLTGTADLRLGQSKYNGVTLDSTSRATLLFNAGKVSTADTAVIQSPMGRITAIGALGLPGGRDDSIAVTLAVDNLGKLRPLFTVDGTPPAKPDSMSGLVTVNGYARGRLDSLVLTGVINGDKLFIRGLRIDSLTAPFTLNDVLRSPSGQVTANAAKVTLGGLDFDSLTARVDVIDSAHAAFNLRGAKPGSDSLRLGSTGAWSRFAGATTVRLDSFALGFGASQWHLESPATLFGDATTLRLDSLGLRSNRGGVAGMAGAAPATGPIDWRVYGAGIPLSDLNRVIGQTRAPVAGVGDFSVRMTGTRAAPLIDARTTLDSILLSGVGIGKLFASGRYADDRATASADIFQGAKRVLHAQADSLPLAVRWLTYDTLPGRVKASAVADSADFTLIQAWVSDISKVVGKMSGTLALDGTWSKPNAFGQVSVVDGGMRIDTLGIALSRIYGQVSLQNDTIRVDTLSAASGGNANTASLRGRLTVARWLPSWFDLSMTMKDFLAYDRPELATVYARTDSGPVRLWGTLADDSLTGVIQVDRGAIYLPDSKLVGRVFSTLDTLAFRTGRSDTTLLQRITDNLKTSLGAHIGGTFKLSADYADVPLTGDLSIVPVASTDVASRSRDYVSRLAPVGTIYADRGTYALVLPFFSKDFDVQRGGTITFDRDAQWNGVLNLTARYVLRKPGQPDIPILVDVKDRLLTPTVKLRSEASFPISESDLISYLVFGEPGFDIFGQTARTLGGEGLVSSLFTPIATSWASEQLKNTLLGRWFDQFRLSTASLDQSAGGTTAGNLLFNTRLNTGKSFRDNTVFAGASYGFCGFNSQYRQGLQSFGQSYSALDQLGVTLEYRRPSSLTRGSTIQAASEPSTVALLCSPSFTGSQGIAPTPRQLSLSYLWFSRW